MAIVLAGCGGGTTASDADAGAVGGHDDVAADAGEGVRDAGPAGDTDLDVRDGASSDDASIDDAADGDARTTCADHTSVFACLRDASCDWRDGGCGDSTGEDPADLPHRGEGMVRLDGMARPAVLTLVGDGGDVQGVLAIDVDGETLLYRHRGRIASQGDFGLALSDARCPDGGSLCDDIPAAAAGQPVFRIDGRFVNDELRLDQPVPLRTLTYTTIGLPGLQFTPSDGFKPVNPATQGDPFAGTYRGATVSEIPGAGFFDGDCSVTITGEEQKDNYALDMISCQSTGAVDRDPTKIDTGSLAIDTSTDRFWVHSSATNTTWIGRRSNDGLFGVIVADDGSYWSADASPVAPESVGFADVLGTFSWWGQP